MKQICGCGWEGEASELVVCGCELLPDLKCTDLVCPECGDETDEGETVEMSTYDKFQGMLRTPIIFQTLSSSCKTVLELIQAVEKECQIKSPTASGWVKTLIEEAATIKDEKSSP